MSHRSTSLSCTAVRCVKYDMKIALLSAAELGLSAEAIHEEDQQIDVHTAVPTITKRPYCTTAVL